MGIASFPGPARYHLQYEICTEARSSSSRDAYHRCQFTSHQILQNCCVAEITTNGVEEHGTGHTRMIDYNSQLELKKTRSRNPGST